MEKLKVVNVDSTGITFENGIKLTSEHSSDCCESHELTFTDITLDDFKDLEFDLTGETFFNRIKDYGIELVPISGHTVKIPGHGYNNGYYSDQLDLVLTGPGFKKEFDITECQVVEG